MILLISLQRLRALMLKVDRMLSFGGAFVVLRLFLKQSVTSARCSLARRLLTELK